MKRILTAVVLPLCFSLAAIGCSSKEKTAQPDPGTQHQAQGEPAWKLVFKASCGEAAPEQCLGAYGFTVMADGRYEVGPGPAGQVKTGKLDAEELKRLEDSLVRAPQEQLSAATVACPKVDEAESEESVRLLRPSDSATEIQICFDESASTEMKALHSTLRSLAEKFYPLPFPDVCADSVAAAEAMHVSARSCATDKDCAYIDNTYFPIPNGQMQLVITDDCSVLAPIMVGNAATVAERQEQLSAARTAVHEACGAKVLRLECPGIKGFQATDGAPVCSQNVCQVSPSVTL